MKIQIGITYIRNAAILLRSAGLFFNYLGLFKKYLLSPVAQHSIYAHSLHTGKPEVGRSA